MHMRVVHMFIAHVVHMFMALVVHVFMALVVRVFMAHVALHVHSMSQIACLYTHLHVVCC